MILKYRELFRNSLGESDSLVGLVEVSVISLDEAVTEDHGETERGREVDWSNTDNTLSLSLLGGHLQDVHLRSQSVSVVSDLEDQVWETVDLGAVNVSGSSDFNQQNIDDLWTTNQN